MTNYKFKKHKLTADEKLWMEELLAGGFSKLDPQVIKITLLGKISPEFNPDRIDRRIVQNNQLTLLGLWLLNPKHALIANTDEVLKESLRQIKGNPHLKEIEASEVAAELEIAKEDVKIIFKLLLDLRFFDCATGSQSGIGYSSVGFGTEFQGLNKILAYKGIEESLEKFYTSFPNTNKLSRVKKSKKESSAWSEIEKEYGVSKKIIGKKINFVKGKYKREIIFRDIEHSFLLAKSDFNKPAVILAGSVIEEILRLFLTHKGLLSGDNNFFNYTEICKKNKLLTNGISQMTESVRSFRNLVHLRAEDSSKTAVTKSKATGAVSAIFTIINDF